MKSILSMRAAVTINKEKHNYKKYRIKSNSLISAVEFIS
jgi:hypothetical protein